MRREQVKPKPKFNKLYILTFGLIIIIAALLIFHIKNRVQVVTSYSVNQTATLPQNTKLAKLLGGRQNASNGASTQVTVKKYYLLTQDKKKKVYAQVTVNDNTYYVKASNLALNQSNAVNRYVAQLNYPHVAITRQYSKQFTQRAYSTSSQKPRGVVIHDTGTDYSTIKSEVSYMEQHYHSDQIFVHTFIDSSEIFNIANTKYMAEGAGPKANPYYVQFEMTHEYSARSFAKQLANAAYYTAYTLKNNNLPVTRGTKDGSGTVWTHSMVSSYLGGTDHVDPNSYWTTAARKYFGTTYNVNDFIELVQAYYNRL